MRTEATGVAETIIQQIGNRAFQMMGTQQIVRMSLGDSIRFDIKGSRFNKVQVTLDPNDTYTVEVQRIRGMNIMEDQERNGIYADGLHQCIEILTGLRLSL